MIELATHILDSKAAHFDPSKFEDRYEIVLKALVKHKAAGKPIKAIEREEKPDNVVSLMDALQASLKGGKVAKHKATTSRRATGTKTTRKARDAATRHRRTG